MGNKVSIKEKFESFVTLTPENILSTLQEILTQKLTDEEIKLGVLPNTIRKFIQENQDSFTLTITAVFLALFIL